MWSLESSITCLDTRAFERPLWCFSKKSLCFSLSIWVTLLSDIFIGSFLYSDFPPMIEAGFGVSSEEVMPMIGCRIFLLKTPLWLTLPEKFKETWSWEWPRMPLVPVEFIFKVLSDFYGIDMSAIFLMFCFILLLLVIGPPVLGFTPTRDNAFGARYMKSTLAEPVFIGSMSLSSMGVVSPATWNSEKICFPKDNGFCPLIADGVLLKKLFVLSVEIKLFLKEAKWGNLLPSTV